MTKRKFIKPDDSDSEYEWEEAEPKNIKSPEILKNDNNNELSDFLNSYTTKSSKDLRKESKNAEKEREEKLFEDRVCVQTEVEKQQIDNNWLRRVFNRIKELSNSTGEDFMAMLRERYDEKTIDMMIKLCGNHHGHRNRYDKESKHAYQKGKEHYNEDRSSSSTKTREKSPLMNHKNDVEERYVTSVDLNEAAAALIKAEISGNSSKISKLKKKLDILREAQRRNLKVRLTRIKKNVDENKSIMIEKTLKSGRMVPYMETGRRFEKQSFSNEHGLSSIDRLIREETSITADDNDLDFASAVGRTSIHKTRYEDTVECEYAGVSEPKRRQIEKSMAHDKRDAIAAQKKRSSQVSNCKRCYQGLPKHLILSKGEYFCLIVPDNLGIMDFHWQLVPLAHVAASTRFDDDSWEELVAFKKRIIEFYKKELQSECVFLETVVKLKEHPHTVIECVPVETSRDSFSFSNKVFFKKEIDDAKSEWCQNKKVSTIIGGDIRRTIPKEFPYFAVEFDDDEGLAFVIDDERKFSASFGLEIVGSLLGKSKMEVKGRQEGGFNAQADVVLRAEKRWRSYDLWKGNDSDESD